MTPPRRILLTGGTGFVGRHLQAALAAAYPAARLALGAADIRDAEAVSAMIAVERPEVCIHLAAVSTTSAVRADEADAWRVNLHGPLHVARALLREAPDCQMLFVSSADAYGASLGVRGTIDEDAPLAPANLYAATKAAADLTLGSMVGEGLRLVRLRPSNHTGPGQSPDLVIAAFARQIARIAAGLQPALLETGDLTARRDFLDVRDVCTAYVACIDRRETLPRDIILNLGSGTPRRIGEVLEEMLAVAGVTAEVRPKQQRMRIGDVERPRLDASRAEAVLGWQPRIPWSQTLRDVLEDWRARVASGSEDA